VKVGSGRRHCLSLNAPITGVLKSRGVPFNGGVKDEATWHLFLFNGGGRGQPWRRREASCWRRLACSDSVREEEEEGRRVPWQTHSLRENVFPEICQGHVRAKWADEGKRQPRKEWVGTVKKEEGGQWGRGGISLAWPVGQDPGRGRLVGRADLWENGKINS
jgi:hypothetical protein